MCTFQFSTDRSYQKVAWALLDTPFKFSVVYGEVHYHLPRCVTVWGEAAIENVRQACDEAGIKYREIL